MRACWSRVCHSYEREENCTLEEAEETKDSSTVWSFKFKNLRARRSHIPHARLTTTALTRPRDQGGRGKLCSGAQCDMMDTDTTERG